MRILLGSGLRNDPKISVVIVQKELQNRFISLGHPTDSILGDRFKIRIKRATELEFSLRSAFLDLNAYDVLDFKLGDGLYPALRVKKFSRRPLIVARSHGLDFLYYANRIKYGYSPSWREKLYAGKYLMWQVRKHLESSDLCLLLNTEEFEYCRDVLKLDKSKLPCYRQWYP